MEEGLVKMVFATVAMAALSRLLIYVYNMVWWKPERMREALGKQGIKGHPILLSSLELCSR